MRLWQERLCIQEETTIATIILSAKTQAKVAMSGGKQIWSTLSVWGGKQPRDLKIHPKSRTWWLREGCTILKTQDLLN